MIGSMIGGEIRVWTVPGFGDICVHSVVLLEQVHKPVFFMIAGLSTVATADSDTCGSGVQYIFIVALKVS